MTGVQSRAEACHKDKIIAMSKPQRKGGGLELREMPGGGKDSMRSSVLGFDLSIITRANELSLVYYKDFPSQYKTK